MTGETADRRHAEALQHRYQRYAVKFILDCGMDGRAPENAEPTDANLALNLGHCGRPAKPAEYPAIRMHVDTYRMAQLSTAASVRDMLLNRADSYARDSATFADVPQLHDLITEDECKVFADIYRTVSAELRKVAESL